MPISSSSKVSDHCRRSKPVRASLIQADDTRRTSANSCPATLGCRVKSGWATAVLLAAPADKPRVLDRCRIDLSDPADPETRQPFHAGTGREETDDTKIRRRTGAVEGIARQSVGALIERYREANTPPCLAALVVGSLADPDSIANPHIRAHASEGRLFRTVLAEALRACGVQPEVFVARSIYAEAVAGLKRQEDDVRQLLVSMGRAVGRPWGAEEKVAALAAWLRLISPESPQR